MNLAYEQWQLIRTALLYYAINADISSDTKNSVDDILDTIHDVIGSDD